jgi:protein ImuB
VTERVERVLEAWYPDWPVVAAGVPAGEPAAVVVTNRVVAASPAARSEGVVPGLQRREAQGRCPEVALLAADPARDARRWEPVVAVVEAFAPGVEVAGPGTVGVGTRGPSRYFGGDAALAAKVAAAVDAVVGEGGGDGAGCRVGVADGRFAAALAAREGFGLSGGAAPEGMAVAAGRVVVVAPGASRGWLADRPVATLGAPELVDLLTRLGIRTLGQLAELPADAVLARFGPEGAVARRRALGLDEHPLTGRVPPLDLAVTAEIDPPVDRVDRAAFEARHLADRLHAGLAAQGLACTRVGIEAETEHGERLARRWRHEGTLDAAAVAERVRWQLDAWLQAPGVATAGLTLLRLVPEEVAPDHGRQLGLWGDAVTSARVARSLTRVQGLLGPDAVLTATLGGGRDPADQVQLVPWGSPRDPRLPGWPQPGGAPGLLGPPEPAPRAPAGGAGRRRAPRRTMGRSAHEVAPWPGALPGPAPSVVHPTARPARVLDASGREVVVDGRGEVSAPPAELGIDAGPTVAVTAWAGPWPVEERWWDGGGRRRARFQVQVATGAAHLVVREGGRWWVTATYD